jgi:hypothetical protein
MVKLKTKRRLLRNHNPDRHDGKARSGEKDWERIYNELAVTIEHNDTEMEGHTQTFKDRAKRLLQLRDTRAREAELIRLERGITTTTQAPRENNTAGPNTLRAQQLQQRPPTSFQNRNTVNDFDHRDYGEGTGRLPRHQDGDGHMRGGHYDGHVRGGHHDGFQSRGAHHDGYQARRFSREPSPRGGPIPDSIRDVSRDADPVPKESGGSAKPPPSRSQMQPAITTVRRCYNCGGEDHLASECPKTGGDGGARRRAAGSRSPSGRA